MSTALLFIIIMLNATIIYLYVALNKLKKRVEKLEQDIQREIEIEVVGNATGCSVVGAGSIQFKAGG